MPLYTVSAWFILSNAEGSVPVPIGIVVPLYSSFFILLYKVFVNAMHFFRCDLAAPPPVSGTGQALRLTNGSKRYPCPYRDLPTGKGRLAPFRLIFYLGKRKDSYAGHTPL